MVEKVHRPTGRSTAGVPTAEACVRELAVPYGPSTYGARRLEERAEDQARSFGARVVKVSSPTEALLADQLEHHERILADLMAHLCEVGMLTQHHAAGIFGLSLDDFQQVVAKVRQQNGENDA